MADGSVVVTKPGNAGGAKGPWFRTNARRGRRAEGLAMSLHTLLKVQTLQAALHAKAKGSPSVKVARRTGVKAFRAVDRHTAHRRRQWLRKTHKVPGRGTARYPDESRYQKPNLIRLAVRTRNFTWANA